MTTKELIDKKFGIRTDVVVNPLVSSVGTSVTRLLGNNPNRVAWRIVNLSSNNLYILNDEEVSSSRGIMLYPNGGTASMVWDKDFNTVCWEVYGVRQLY